MKISRIVLFFLLTVFIEAFVTGLYNLPQDAGPNVPDGKISSVSFAPFREGQSPLTLTFPSLAELDEDLKMLSDETRSVRTYSSTGGLRDIPRLAQKYGLEVIQGAWLGGTTMAKENEEEISALIKAANDYPDVIKRVIVGNEVLLRGELEPEQLLSYIRRVKQSIKQPVSYADVWSFYMRYPEIANEVDFFTVHILPYWEDEPIPVEKTADHIVNNYLKIRDAYPGKPILIGESGWPSAGRQRGFAVPSVVNAAKFIRSLVQVANQNGFDYNIVEAFNQPWKSKFEGVVGASWGLYSVDRKSAFPLEGKVVENPHWPLQVLSAGLLTLFVLAVFMRHLAELSAGKQFAFVAFTQLLVALQVNQTINLWSTSYNNQERFHALSIALLGAALLVLILRRAAALLQQIPQNPRLLIYSHYLFLVFVALALYKAQALAINGRYLNIPYPLTVIPVCGSLGLFALGYLGWERAGKSIFGGLDAVQPARRTVINIGLALAATGIALLALETYLTMTGDNFPTAYPVFTDRLYAALSASLAYSQLQGWVLLIAAAVFVVPLKWSVWALILAIPGTIFSEANAFLEARDFIDAYPNQSERIKTALMYTVCNQRIMLWLASLAVLAAALWPSRFNRLRA